MPHHLGAHGIEVGFAAQRNILKIDPAQIDFVNQVGGL
jgi:hypothetical protein